MKKLLAIVTVWLALASPTLAANVNIDGLPAASSVTGTDLFECEQSGTNNQCTSAQILNYTQTNAVPLSSTAALNYPVGGLNGAGVGPFWLTTAMGGTCVETVNCVPNFFQMTDNVNVTASANGLRQWWFQGVMGTSATGGRTLMFDDLNITAVPADAGTDRTYQTLQPNVIASVNVGGTGPAPLGHLFSLNPTCKMNSGATNWISNACIEVDNYIATGASAQHFGFAQFVIASPHAVAGSISNFGLLFGKQASGSPGLEHLIEDGGHQGWPAISTTGYVFGCKLNTSETDCGTIGGGIDLSNYATVSGRMLNGAAGTYYWDGAGNINAASLTSGGLAVASGYQVVTSTSTVSTATGATTYYSVGCGQGTQNCEGYAPNKITVNNLHIALSTAPGTGNTVTATLVIGSKASLSGTTLTCQVTDTNVICSDLTHSATVSAGQYWAIQLVSSASAAGTGTALFEFETKNSL